MTKKSKKQIAYFVLYLVLTLFFATFASFDPTVAFLKVVWF